MTLKLDYIEISSTDMSATTRFLTDAFGWQFNDYGPVYQEFANAGVSGGVAAGDAAPLPILKTDDLEAALQAVTDAGGQITQPIFAFPGGRRFQFRAPGGPEMAVWSPV